MLLPDWLDPQKIIEAAGPWALWIVAIIVFAECGLFSLLPGDSLLFTVGMFTAGGLAGGVPAIHYFSSRPGTLIFCCVVLTIAAILGNISGYYLGRLIGPPLFKPRKGLMGKVFDPVYVEKTHALMEKYGPRALILARFVPMVRTFITLIAGVSKMDFKKFIIFTAIGGVLWVWLITILGYFLGTIPWIQHNLEAMLILIVFISVIPMAIEIFNGWRENKKSAANSETTAS